MQRRAVVFSGRVQGVGFRATARSVAARFSVSGWVRNEPNGTVRMEVQGPAEEVEAVLRTLGERMHGHISRTTSEEMLPVPEETAFEIRR